MNEAKTDANISAETVPAHEYIERAIGQKRIAEWARRCQDQLAAKQSKALAAANLADIAAASNGE